MAGHVVYGVCVIVANLVIFVKSNIHHYFSVLCISLMIIAYFLFYGVMAATGTFDEVYVLFAQTFNEGIVWNVIFLSVLLSTAFELVLKYQEKLDELFPDPSRYKEDP